MIGWHSASWSNGKDPRSGLRKMLGMSLGREWKMCGGVGLVVGLERHARRGFGYYLSTAWTAEGGHDESVMFWFCLVLSGSYF